MGHDDFVYLHGELLFHPLLLLVQVFGHGQLVGHVLFKLHVNADEVNQVFEALDELLRAEFIEASVEESL